MREYVETPPDDDMPLDADALRAAELADAEVPTEEIEELFRITDEMRTSAGVVLQFVRALPVAMAGYVGEMSPAEFSLERVRREFGPGTYRLRVMGPKGYIPGGGKLVVAQVPEKPVNSTGVDDVLAILKADKEASGAKFKEWAVILTPLVSPLVQSWLQPKNQVSELVQGLAALKGLQPPEKPAEPLSAQLDQIAGVMAKLKELAGEEKSSTGATWIDLIRDAVQGVKPILEGVAARVGGPPPSPQGIPIMAPVALPGPAPLSAPVVAGSVAPSSIPSNGSSPENKPVGVISLLPWLSQTLQQLIQQAAHNRDPELYAEVTLDNLPDGTDPKELIPFLERADWWEQLRAFVPAVAPYPAWFADYRAAVLEMLKGAPNLTPAPEATTANELEPRPMSDPDPGDGM